MGNIHLRGTDMFEGSYVTTRRIRNRVRRESLKEVYNDLHRRISWDGWKKTEYDD